MKRKIISLIVSSVLFLSTLVGCGSSISDKGEVDTNTTNVIGNAATQTNGEKTKIRVYLGGDNADLNLNLVEAFNKQSTSAEAEIVTLTEGQSGYQMLTVMYNSSSAPNVFFLEAGDIVNLQDKLSDVAEMTCIQYASAGTLDDVTYDEKILGVPVKTQAFGIIYNKTAIKKILGSSFDINSITSLADFKEICKEIKEKDIAATVISPYNWSLGNHYFNMIYSGQDDSDLFIESLKNGNADLANNKVFNSYMNTFDVLKSYNYYIENPLQDVADEAVKQSKTLYTEEAIFWFQGSWNTSNIRQLDNENEYGFIPVPLETETEINYGKICSLVPGYFCVDSSNSTEAQQNAAKEFIDFAIMSDKGQEYVIEDGNIPAYTNNSKEITESLINSAYDYISSGNTFQMYTKYPADHYEKVGNLMQQYLDNKIDRTELASGIEEYWRSQN